MRDGWKKSGRPEVQSQCQSQWSRGNWNRAGYRSGRGNLLIPNLEAIIIIIMVQSNDARLECAENSIHE